MAAIQRALDDHPAQGIFYLANGVYCLTNTLHWPPGHRSGQEQKLRVMQRRTTTESERHLKNDGAQLWILGIKTEGTGPEIITPQGGATELLGGLMYSRGGVIYNNLDYSFAVGREDSTDLENKARWRQPNLAPATQGAERFRPPLRPRHDESQSDASGARTRRHVARVVRLRMAKRTRSTYKVLRRPRSNST